MHQALAPISLDIADDFGSRLTRSFGIYHYRGACRGELECDGATDIAGGTCHDRDAAFQRSTQAAVATTLPTPDSSATGNIGPHEECEHDTQRQEAERHEERRQVATGEVRH